MFRKPRRATHEFGIGSPFNAITGDHADLQPHGIFPYCALVQVAKADTYTNYVVCRGFDIRQGRFIDYRAGDPNNPGISVAKPYGSRTIGQFNVGEVYPAFLPTQLTEDSFVAPSPADVPWRIGQNAGTADPINAGGHPATLASTISELVDHNGTNVQWLLVAGGESTPSPVYWGKAKTNWVDNGANVDSVDVNPCADAEGTTPDAETTFTVLLPKTAERDPNVIADEIIAYELASDGTYVCTSDYLDDKIGTVKMWALGAAAIPPGWAIMDGSDNAAPAGSGIDLDGFFVKSAASSGTEGGEQFHTHDFMLEILPHTIDQIKVSLDHTHTITIQPHTVEQLFHKHAIPLDTPSNGWKWPTLPDVPDQAPVYPCTGEPVVPADPESVSDCYGSEWGPLTHVGTADWAYSGGITPQYDLYHEYTGYMKQTATEPRYKEMIFIERIDNSA